MPLKIIHQDLTQMNCDAIVNPTDEQLSGSGGTDYAIHMAAGTALDKDCEKIKNLQTGAVAITDAYHLPCRYVFHTIGPVWHGGSQNEAILLRSCYLNSLLKAKKMGLTSIAFPLISSGRFGFPKDRVLRIAIDAISDFLFSVDSELQIYICILDRCSFALSREIALSEYIGTSSKRFTPEDQMPRMYRPGARPRTIIADAAPMQKRSARIACDGEVAASKSKPPRDLADWLKKQDDTFAVTLLKLIDKKGMTDVQCYKKANVSKGTFWKINNDPKYRPSKETVIAFAVALELNIEETEQLLKTVGFTLSNSYVFDRIIMFYILNGNYDIFEINAALFQYDQVCLGC